MGLLLLVSIIIPTQTTNAQSSVLQPTAPFTCDTTETVLATLNVPRISLGTGTIYTGYTVAADGNLNPILVRFNSGEQVWCRSDYETSSVSHYGYALYDDGVNLYVGFTTEGAADNPSRDFRRFAEDGWLPTYGTGNGRAAVIAAVNRLTGEVQAATFVSAVLLNGNTNSITITGLTILPNGNLLVQADSSRFPREIDGSPMVCTSGTYTYQLELTPSLEEAVGALATNCTASISPPPSIVAIPDVVSKIEPSEGQLIEDGAVSFQWYKERNSSWYRVFFYREGEEAGVSEWYQSEDICVGEVCTVRPISMTSGTYYWYVAGWNDDGHGPWGDPTRFYINQRPPGATTILNPSGIVNDPLTTLEWSVVPTATWYRLYIAETDNLTVPAVDVWYAASDVCDVVTRICALNLADIFLTNGNYTWWILTWGEGGVGTWTPDGVQFQLDVPAPMTITQLNPGMSGREMLVGTSQVDFQWQSSPGANWYRLYVGEQDTLAVVVDRWFNADEICLAAICQVSLDLADGDYTWFTNGWGPGGFGSWNSGLRFAVNSDA